jgi:hypothetical protein
VETSGSTTSNIPTTSSHKSSLSLPNSKCTGDPSLNLASSRLRGFEAPDPRLETSFGGGLRATATVCALFLLTVGLTLAVCAELVTSSSFPPDSVLIDCEGSKADRDWSADGRAGLEVSNFADGFESDATRSRLIVYRSPGVALPLELNVERNWKEAFESYG